MYAGMPTTQSGSFTMTTISIKSAFESRGDAGNGYSSKTFARFQQYLNTFQSRVEARYANATYPAATGLQGKFDPANGTVDKYSSDVMIPAFLAAYTGGGDINSPVGHFPESGTHAAQLDRILQRPGLPALDTGPLQERHPEPLLQEHLLCGGLQYVQQLDGVHGRPGIHTKHYGQCYHPEQHVRHQFLSINEAFSPLAGLDLTLNNNMTVKVEYRKTRVLTPEHDRGPVE